MRLHGDRSEKVPAEKQIDTYQQAQCPNGGARRCHNDDIGEQQIENAID
jgi:hypothetical protein